MKIKTMKELEQVVERAIRGEHHLGIFIEMPDFPEPELITNPTTNLTKKLAYWKNTYNANLEHKHASGIRIIGYTL